MLGVVIPIRENNCIIPSISLFLNGSHCKKIDLYYLRSTGGLVQLKRRNQLPICLTTKQFGNLQRIYTDITYLIIVNKSIKSPLVDILR